MAAPAETPKATAPEVPTLAREEPRTETAGGQAAESGGWFASASESGPQLEIEDPDTLTRGPGDRPAAPAETASSGQLDGAEADGDIGQGMAPGDESAGIGGNGVAGGAPMGAGARVAAEAQTTDAHHVKVDVKPAEGGEDEAIDWFENAGGANASGVGLVEAAVPGQRTEEAVPPSGAGTVGAVPLNEAHAPPPRGRAMDPEQVLAGLRFGVDPETLREVADDPEELRVIRERLSEKLAAADGDAARARLLSLRAVVSRILGDLGMALTDGRDALMHAQATGQLRRTAIVRARLAHILQWRGEFAEADRLFAEANSTELPDRLRATMHEHAGRSCLDQGRLMEACLHFERALDLRTVSDTDLVARTETALDAVLVRAARDGWGPYPRDRDEVLQRPRLPMPAFDDHTGTWGYTDAYGVFVVPPRWAQAMPFQDGLAWVRRDQVWELVDPLGATLIDTRAGLVGVQGFSDGLAWVTRGEGWFAIDAEGRIAVPGGFEDVRAFQDGVAPVRCGGWGAVDTSGRFVVPARYGGFVTALADGRYVDGFTDEGLAIVELDGRRGVVDRAGRSILPLRFSGLIIHPVAFLVADFNGSWGALDRRGGPLIDLVHRGRDDVIEEIDQLLADTRPLL